MANAERGKRCQYNGRCIALHSSKRSVKKRCCRAPPCSTKAPVMTVSACICCCWSLRSQFGLLCCGFVSKLKNCLDTLRIIHTRVAISFIVGRKPFLSETDCPSKYFCDAFLPRHFYMNATQYASATFVNRGTLGDLCYDIVKFSCLV